MRAIMTKRSKRSYGTVPLLEPYDSDVETREDKDKEATVRQRFEHFEKSKLRPQVLLPKNKFLKTWDIIVSAAICWTSMVTVFEVCVLKDEVFDYGALFFCVMIVLDVIFIVDTILTFFRAYRLRDGSQRLETNLRRIQRHYLLSTNFLVDLLSSIPFDIIIYSFRRVVHGKFRFLRLLRLLRLHRMLRVMTESYVWKQLELRVNSATRRLIFLGFLMILVNHWFACLLVFLQEEEEGYEADETWLQVYMDRRVKEVQDLSPFEKYVIALYWSVTTVTSVGYGDIVPVNTVEYVIHSMLMFMGGFLWTYIIGQVSGIIIIMEARNMDRKMKMDDINTALAEMSTQLSTKRCDEIRSYMYRVTRAPGYQMQYHEKPLDMLSPELQVETLVGFYKQALDKVWYFRKLSKKNMAIIAQRIQVKSFAKREHFYLPPGLGVVTQGLVLVSSKKNGSVMGSQMTVLSEDFMVRDPDVPKLKAMSFLELFFIPEQDLLEIASENSVIQEELDRAYKFYTLHRWARSIHAIYNTKPPSAPEKAPVAISNGSRSRSTSLDLSVL